MQIDLLTQPPSAGPDKRIHTSAGAADSFLQFPAPCYWTLLAGWMLPTSGKVPNLSAVTWRKGGILSGSGQPLTEGCGGLCIWMQMNHIRKHAEAYHFPSIKKGMPPKSERLLDAKEVFYAMVGTSCMCPSPKKTIPKWPLNRPNQPTGSQRDSSSGQCSKFWRAQFLF